MSTNLVPVTPGELQSIEQLPALIRDSGKAAHFAYQEFFYGKIRNPPTRLAYERAVRRFLSWCKKKSLELQQISPGHVGVYVNQHPGAVASKKQTLAALRHFFDGLVTRHVIILNPAHSVRAERYQVLEGKTPEITVKQARKLLGSIDLSTVIGLCDRAAIAVLIYTAARVGAVAKLQRRHFYYAGEQWNLHFDDKGGKSREIPVRHDLERYLWDYLDAAGLRDAPKKTPLLRTAVRGKKQLGENAMRAHDLCRMVKRRMKAAGLPSRLSPHSFRVAIITDLLEQGVPLEDVQQLVGHADPRTTRLYDRRQRRITRNIVERISI